MLEVEPTV